MHRKVAEPPHESLELVTKVTPEADFLPTNLSFSSSLSPSFFLCFLAWRGPQRVVGKMGVTRVSASECACV